MATIEGAAITSEPAPPAWTKLQEGAEAERLGALRLYEILDTPPEAAFDELTQLAAMVCETPMAVVSFVDESREWVKSHLGFDRPEFARAGSFGEQIILSPGLFQVEDASADPRFALSPCVQGKPNLRFLAAFPLLDAHSQAIGALSVMDVHPRQLAAPHATALEVISHQVMAQLEVRRKSRQLSRQLTESQATAEALRHSEAVYHSLVEGLPQNIFRKDKLLRFTFANHRFCQMLGKSLAEIVGKTDFEFFPVEMARKYQRDDQRVLDSGKPVDTVEAHQTPSGEKIYVHVLKTPIRDSVGELIGIQGIFWDVTGRKRTEEALAHERDLLNTLLDNIPDHIYYKDSESRYIKCSKAMAASLGISDPQLAIGKTDFDFFNEAYARAAQEDEHRIVRTAQPVIGRAQKETWADGREAWMLTTKMPFRNKDGVVIGTFGIAKDISALKRVESELAYERDLLQSLLVNVPDYIYFKDLESRFIKLSLALAQRFQLDTADQAIGKTDFDFFSEEHARQAYEDEQAIIKTGRPVIGKTEKETWPDGQNTWALTTKMPLRNHDGQVIGTFGVSKDITMLKQVEEELQRARDTALESTRMKSEFLANVSHEIRTPMNAIIGMTGLLLDTQLDEEQRDFLETVRASADALLTIINDILDFSKIEAGKLAFENIDFDLVDMVEGTLELVAARAHAKAIEIASWVHPQVPVNLKGDPGRLRQVLANLLSNAVKFTQQGEVVARVEKEADLEGKVVLRFSVSDTGIGIPPDALPKIFQAFTQADGSTTRKYGGTGLGLAISKQLVELMHGRIGVESLVGQGSTFWFTVPLEKQPAAVESAFREAVEDRLAGLRVLIVDDNATNRQILHYQLSAWRMINGQAANGVDALSALRREAQGGQPYHLAILDHQMPEMDGFTLARAIKQDSELAKTRLVMLTSLGQRSESNELEGTGLAAYLVKPVKQSRLFDCLANVMQEPREPSALTKSGSPPPLPLLMAQPPERELRILVAEDNVVNQKVAVRQLQKLGFGANCVANGLEVLDAVERIPYDVILLDCQMPEMDGFEATHALRNREAKAPGTPPLYIIALTANALQGDRERCLAAGMNDYISKPVQLADLQAALRRAGEHLGAPAEPATKPGPAQAIDPSVLAGLRELRLPDETDPVVELIDLFTQDAAARISQMANALEQQKPAALEASAHSLKGSSSNLGAHGLVALCAELEQCGRRKELSSAPGILARVKAELEHVLRSLEVEKTAALPPLKPDPLAP